MVWLFFEDNGTCFGGEGTWTPLLLFSRWLNIVSYSLGHPPPLDRETCESRTHWQKGGLFYPIYDWPHHALRVHHVYANSSKSNCKCKVIRSIKPDLALFSFFSWPPMPWSLLWLMLEMQFGQLNQRQQIRIWICFLPANPWLTFSWHVIKLLPYLLWSIMVFWHITCTI